MSPNSALRHALKALKKIADYVDEPGNPPPDDVMREIAQEALELLEKTDD